jgi:hypothetical protein
LVVASKINLLNIFYQADGTIRLAANPFIDLLLSKGAK